VSPAGGDALPALLPDDGDLMMVPGSETGHVEEASEYRFFLYRHWSLYDAMYHSPYVASKLCVWNQQGTVKLQVRICWFYCGGLHSCFCVLCCSLVPLLARSVSTHDIS
jgi:hypothetical protein